MKRKFKEGYYCTIDYYNECSGSVQPVVRVRKENLQIIADSGFTCDYAGTPLLDIRFYSPDHKKVSMEEATEIVKEKKEGWINIYPEKVYGDACCYVHPTEAIALERRTRHHCATIKIEWEE